eukprot:TRINITY_DN24169_c0_g1_i1.p1 TRINITY_DN24169_c0_g1~~TRINITY_DN24169_c0_g1_i1.p1  ORF type:complete len:404 (-),score=48.14 TRINITY_DN24169_c0_g1_i1:154-1365(-)
MMATFFSPVNLGKLFCLFSRSSTIARRSLNNAACVTVPQELSIKQLHRRFERLRAFQSQLQWPKIDSFSAFGQERSFPMRARISELEPSFSLSKQELEYLVGFFDGDGCVYSDGAVCLSVTQSSTHGEALLLLWHAFGGSIRRHSHGRGSCKPCVVWRVCGQAGRKAAALLGSVPSAKQPQLQIAANWPLRTSSRVCSRTQLRELKTQAPTNFVCTSWAYVAGFFDAEGCISLPRLAALRLVIGQKHSEILFAISRFLLSSGIDRSKVKTRSNGFALELNKTSECKSVLKSMIQAGLCVKKPAAEAAVSLCLSNYVHVTAQISATVGNQSRYVRCSPAGRSRANEIRKMQTRIFAKRRTGNALEVKTLEEQLAVLKELMLLHPLQSATSLFVMTFALLSNRVP